MGSPRVQAWLKVDAAVAAAAAVPESKAEDDDAAFLRPELASFRASSALRRKACPAAPQSSSKKKLTIIRGDRAADLDLPASVTVEWDSADGPERLAAALVSATESATDGSGELHVVLRGSLPAPCMYAETIRLARAAGFEVRILEVRSASAGEATATSPASSLWRRIAEYSAFEEDDAASSVPLAACYSTPAPKKLVVFDFDKTLLNTTDAPHRTPRGLWVTLPRSLAPSHDMHVTAGPALGANRLLFHGSTEHAKRMVVVLSARKASLSGCVDRLLDKWRIGRDCVILKDSGPEESGPEFKARALRGLLATGQFDSVTAYDDEVSSVEAMLLAAREFLPAAHCEVLDVHTCELPSLADCGEGEDAVATHERALAALQEGVCRILARVLELKTPHPALLGLVFGSTALGAAERDLDLCLLVPGDHQLGNVDVLRELQAKVREDGLGDRLELVGWHLGADARCPRVCLAARYSEGSMVKVVELDAVCMRLDRQSFDQLLNADSMSYADRVAICEAGCDQDDVESTRALAGPKMSAGLLSKAQALGLVPTAFGDLLSRARTFVAAAGLSGKHFHCIKSFQLALLIGDYLDACLESTTESVGWTGLAQFLGHELDREQWESRMIGVHADNWRDFSVANLCYLDRLIAAFAAEADGEFEPFDFEEALYGGELGLVPVLVTFRALPTARWRLQLSLVGAFPGVIRNLLARCGPELLVDGRGELEWEADEVRLLFAVSLARSGTLAHAVQQAVDSLRLPAGTQSSVIVGAAALAWADDADEPVSSESEDGAWDPDAGRSSGGEAWNPELEQAPDQDDGAEHCLKEAIESWAPGYTDTPV